MILRSENENTNSDEMKENNRMKERQEEENNKTKKERMQLLTEGR